MEKLTNISGELLEGCVWNEQNKKLYFIDIECRKIYCLEPSEDKGLTSMDLPGKPGCIVLGKDGFLTAALPDGLYRVDFDGKTLEKIMDSGFASGLRYNDGKCDGAGRLWVGSMAVCQDEKAKERGSLFCIEKNKILREYPGYTIPNGLAWDQEKPYFYHVDTPLRRIDRYELTKDGLLGPRQVLADLRGETGSPDGMTLDGCGDFWVAMWGGSQVICVDGDSGKVKERIPVPERCVSCCTFGGEQMDRLYITTARDENGQGGELYVHKMKVTGVRTEGYGR